MDKKGIPYWHIQQDTDTMSKALKKYMGKRPDYMILIPNFGFILVDVKEYRPNQKYDSFSINREEIMKYSALERYFNLRVWLVFSFFDIHYQTWYWAPVSKIIEEAKEISSSIPFYAFDMTKSYQVSTNDSLDRLFSSIFKEK